MPFFITSLVYVKNLEIRCSRSQDQRNLKTKVEQQLTRDFYKNFRDIMLREKATKQSFMKLYALFRVVLIKLIIHLQIFSKSQTVFRISLNVNSPITRFNFFYLHKIKNFILPTIDIMLP